MQIPSDVLAVLTDRRTVISGDRVQVPFTIDRAVYEQLNKMLKELGGRWNGANSVRAHVFPFQVEEFMRQSILAGEFPSRFDQGWYPTPEDVVWDMSVLAGIRVGMTVLEPSAGTGSIARTVVDEYMGIVDCVELDERRVRVLESWGGARQVIQGDFLGLDPLDWEEGYNRVLMNPPFGDHVRHVLHAVSFARPDSLVLAILPDSVMWHSTRATVEFRELVDEAGGYFEEMAEGSFESSGTSVRTRMLYLPVDEDGPLKHHGWHHAQPRQLSLFAA